MCKSKKNYACLLNCYSAHGMKDQGLELWKDEGPDLCSRFTDVQQLDGLVPIGRSAG
jgi:hypothetical protein